MDMKNKVVGIIAEYNPFHNGHKRQISYAKEYLQADFCVIAMSGNFVQRGTPAIIDKHSRAQMAIAEGADIVFEIPACFATGSLDDFALGSVSLLDSLGLVSHLLFGSESGNIDTISCISQTMMADEKSFSIIRSSMKNGLSAANCQETCLSAILDKKLYADCLGTVNQPNNILGILYLNALSRIQSSIVPATNPRIGQAYLDDSRRNMNRENNLASATAIRKQIHQSTNNSISSVMKYLPSQSYQILINSLRNQRPLSENDFWESLCEKLSKYSGPLTDFRLVTPALADKIAQGWQKCDSWTSLVDHVSFNRISPARVSRCLVHILLGIRDDIVDNFVESEICCYAKVLSTSAKGNLLLERICSTSSIPVLCNDRDVVLSPIAKSQLSIDLAADKLYADRRTCDKV
mgnify:FL=1